MPNSLVIGSVTLDHAMDGMGQVTLRWGGVPVYGGRTLASLGHEVCLVTCMDEDRRGGFMEWCNRNGIGKVLFSGLGLTEFRNEYAGELRQQELLSIAAPIVLSAEIASAVERAEIIQLGPLHHEDVAADVYALVERCRDRVVLDLQGLLRPSTCGIVRHRAHARLFEWIRVAAIGKMSDVEHQDVLESSDIPGDQLLASTGLEELVVTEGASGGFVLTKLGVRHQYRAQQARGAVDSTGAGDVFLATYANARLISGLGVDTACEAAADAAARQVMGEHIGLKDLNAQQRPVR